MVTFMKGKGLSGLFVFNPFLPQNAAGTDLRDFVFDRKKINARRHVSTSIAAHTPAKPQPIYTSKRVSSRRTPACLAR